MKRVVMILALAFVALSIGAAPLVVSWADGKVDLQQGANWVEVSLGDKFDSSATLRLGEGSSVELSGNGRRVSITAAGTYSLAVLFKDGAMTQKVKADVLQKLGKLVDPNVSSTESAVGGVRGAAIQPSTETITWASDDADVPGIMDAGRALVRVGKYSEAALKFDEAAQAAAGTDKDAAQYAEAWALAADGSQARAVALLRAMPDFGIWAGPRALLLARLDIDTGAMAEATSLLDSGLAANLFVGDDLPLAKAMLDEARSSP
ncbi:MAG TPA: hypothetical protein VMV83_00315 [Rectinemataceae bacterium]|nr:hypothetical protein [Rectinemataceae bacterium]